MADSIQYSQVYMPFETLCKTTEGSSIAADADVKERMDFWQKHKQDAMYTDLFIVKESHDTLRGRLFQKPKEHEGDALR